MNSYDYLIIANFLAGKSLAKEKLEELKSFLERKKSSFKLIKINKPTPISEIKFERSLKITKGVICLGGDGTVSETIELILKQGFNLPIFVIPTGTANFIADSLGINKKINFEKIFKGEIKKVDLGVCQYDGKKDYFLLGIGLGFEQKFLAMAKEKSKKILGKLSYFLAAFFGLFRLKPLPYKLSFNQKTFEFQASMLTILNFKPRALPFLPFFLEKDIKANDGKLDIFYVEHKNILFSFLGIIFFHILGRVNFGLVKRFKTKELILDSPSAQKIQIDGELNGKLPLKISLISEGVRFLV